MSPARTQTFSLFVFFTLLLGTASIWVLHNNYSNDVAILHWSSIKAVFDADTLRLENLGFAHPHGPLLLQIPFTILPWGNTTAPYFLSVVLISLLLTIWHKHLVSGGYITAQRVFLIFLIIINPAVLWGATSGGNEAITLLMFYMLYRSCLRMIYEKDIRSFIALGLVLAAFFYFDVLSVFLFISLLPLLILIAPAQMLKESFFSVYIIIGMPLLVVAIAWLYFNWIFLGDPLAFIHDFKSAFTGALIHSETLPWIREYGGQFFRPMLIGMGYIVFCFPVLLFLLGRSYVEGRQLRITIVLMLHPILAIGITTAVFYLASPLQLIILMMAAVMAEISRLGCYRFRCFVPLFSMLIIGTVTSWLLFLHGNYTDIDNWKTALTTRLPPSHVGDRAIGRWLAEHREPTLLDLHSSYTLINARGDAKGLILPFTNQFRLAVRSDRPNVPQIALPDPITATGRYDAVNARYPQLYESGMIDYQLVYDKEGWRVYRKIK